MAGPQEPDSDLIATVEQLPEPECWNLLAGAQSDASVSSSRNGLRSCR